MLAVLNGIAATLREELGQMEDKLIGGIKSIQADLDGVKADMVLCKATVAGGATFREGPKLKVPEPPKFGGTRDAKELDNFLWSIERYFEAMRVEDDASKITTATMYLVDDAILWWRMRHGDMLRETGNSIRTWEDFKAGLKKQFYPENAEELAMKKLRVLQHKGSVKEYIKQFSTLMLEISDMSEGNRLIYFMDGLEGWAETELKRRNVQDLQSAIAVAESLIEFTRESRDDGPKKRSNGDYKGNGDESRFHEDNHRGNGSGTRFYQNDHWGSGNGTSFDQSNHRGNGGGSKFQGGSSSDGGQTLHKGNHYKEQGSKSSQDRVVCFLCGGDHWVREYPQRSKLTALAAAFEAKPTGKEPRIGSLRLLNSLKRTETKELMFVETKMNNQVSKALLDTGATHNFIDKREADRLGLRYDEEMSAVKMINSPSLSVHGVARGVPVHIGEWKGYMNLRVVDMDDYGLILGMAFFDSVRPFVYDKDGNIEIYGGKGISSIKISREKVDGKRIASLRLERGPSKEFKERPKKLPLRGKVDDKHRRLVEFQVGDLVMIKLRSREFKAFREMRKGPVRRLEGPFRVVRKVGKGSYEVKLPPKLKIPHVFHESYLKAFHGDKEEDLRLHQDQLNEFKDHESRGDQDKETRLTRASTALVGENVTARVSQGVGTDLEEFGSLDRDNFGESWATWSRQLWRSLARYWEESGPPNQRGLEENPAHSNILRDSHKSP